MTAFVLAWTRPGANLDPGVTSHLKAALAPAGALQCITTARFAVVAWDSNIWPGSSVSADSSGGVVIAGDPVVRVETDSLERPASVGLFRTRLLTETTATLRSAEGTYAGVAWDSDGRAVVCTDKLGVRPIYWASVGEIVYASTTQWALSRISDIPQGEDLRGIIEASVFGAPLADRTFRTAIHSLGAGEILDLRGDTARIVQYWDWTQLTPAATPDADRAEYILQMFGGAVAARLQSQSRVFAFLSGGMDSRLIVSELRRLGADVSSMNFAPPGSQDLIYGRMAAEVAGTQHFEFDEGGTNFAERRNSALRNWDVDSSRAALKPSRSGLVWSGDGGSVALGHVYMDPKIVRVARSGDLLKTAQAIQMANSFVLSPRSFNRAHRELVEVPVEGIREDLASRQRVEPGRNAHLFFMLNDQRRHLVEHFETLHQHKIDLVLPFFDGRFLTAILSSPIDPFLMHSLYNQVVALLPFGLGQVPWQSYPGHVPCPVTTEVTGRHQWSEGWYSTGAVRREARKRMAVLMRIALSPRFPKDVLSRSNLTLAALSGMTGSSRFGYLWNPARALLVARGINQT